MKRPREIGRRLARGWQLLDPSDTDPTEEVQESSKALRRTLRREEETRAQVRARVERHLAQFLADDLILGSASDDELVSE